MKQLNLLIFLLFSLSVFSRTPYFGVSSVRHLSDSTAEKPTTRMTTNQIVIWDKTETSGFKVISFLEDMQEPEIKVFPNPVSGNEVNIIANKEITVQVYDVLGKKVMQQTITKNQNRLDVSGLRRGVYILRLKTGTVTLTKKLIKQ